jgi:hypothetical protein
MIATYPKATEEIAQMVFNNIDSFREWGIDRVREWVQWFVNNDRFYAISCGGKLVGVTLFRMVDVEEDCHEHYRDTNGEICYIEATVSDYPSGLKVMYDILWNDVGKDSTWMAWVRGKHNNRVVMVEMNKAKRRFMR